jgi:hypothetical protein
MIAQVCRHCHRVDWRQRCFARIKHSLAFAERFLFAYVRGSNIKTMCNFPKCGLSLWVP